MPVSVPLIFFGYISIQKLKTIPRFSHEGGEVTKKIYLSTFKSSAGIWLWWSFNKFFNTNIVRGTQHATARRSTAAGRLYVPHKSYTRFVRDV